MSDLADRYAAAFRLAPERLVPLIRNRRVVPTWTGTGDTFWYRRQLAGDRTEAVLVDPAAGTRTVVPDDDPRLVAAAPRPAGVRSLDGRREAFRRGDDLWWRDLGSGVETRLTHDGEPHRAWGALPDNVMVRLPLRRAGLDVPPAGTAFSPSGRYLVTVRVDERDVRAVTLVEHLPASGARPVAHEIRALLDEDDDTGEHQLAVLDLLTGQRLLAAVGRDAVMALVTLGPAAATFSHDESELYVFAHDLGSPCGRLLAVSTATGDVRTVVEETEDGPYEPNTYLYNLPLVTVLPRRGEVLWFSQRDGWGHLYRYALRDGALLGRVTQGELVVTDVLRCDEERGEVLLLAGSGHDGRNPYWRTLYRVALDGSSQVLLTPEPCDHGIPAPAPEFFELIFGAHLPPVAPLSPSGDWVVDCLSTPADPPVSVLRSTRTGEVVLELERADVSALLAAGYVSPQPFCVQVDGAAVWGVLTLPPDLSPGSSVPVVDLMYAGFQMRTQPICYLGDVQSAQGSDAASYAALGLATVVLDGRGTPGRDRAFRRHGQGRPQEVDPLADHVAALRALGAQVPALDLSRVGVTGHSYGGYNSVRALLLHPGFFRAAVSSAGAHVPDKLAHGAWAWHLAPGGDRSSDAYRALGNLHLVDRLEGALLLQHGLLDENCTVDHVFALTDALMRAGKRFDLKLWPRADHYTSSPYATMTTWDHFVRHLLGLAPPADVTPPAREDSLP